MPKRPLLLALVSALLCAAPAYAETPDLGSTCQPSPDDLGCPPTWDLTPFPSTNDAVFADEGARAGDQGGAVSVAGGGGCALAGSAAPVGGPALLGVALLALVLSRKRRRR